jgi:SAM domain (Sterile alpha motif)
MQQVADWLETLGLGQYAQRFAENDIDFALLTKLTDANLKELGVTSLGHVGSTALSARMDPEDLREVISAYQKCVAETVQRFGGFVARYMGDGVVVYFGYPQAPRGRCRTRSESGS